MSDIDEIKAKNRIEDVIGETYPLRHERGRYLKAQEHDSLVVDTEYQRYYWNSQGQSGDVIGWLEAQNGWEFKTAVEALARRAGLPEPNWGKEDNTARLAMRAREDAFEVAARLFQKWLLADGDALVYAMSRGWTDETIQDAMLGFSGRATTAAYNEMRGELQMHQIELDHPDAVAILGLRGGVVEWGKKWNIELQANWIKWGLVPGIMGRTRLVYTHMVGGRVRYFSGRNILGAEIGEDGKEIKAFNLAGALIGEKYAYFNPVYKAHADEVVLVEGQADAITLGQWGVAAVALGGTGWQAFGELIKDLHKRHRELYVGMDSDSAGKKALQGEHGDWPLVPFVGPMARVMTWPEVDLGDGKKGNDANDWLKAMVKEEKTIVEQREAVYNRMAAAVPIGLAAAKWAGGKRGADQDQALKTAFSIIAQMEKFYVDRYREAMTNAMGVGVRDFNAMLKSARAEAGKDDDERTTAELAETLGGYIDGWLIEYLYDQKTNKARFAFRDPDGKIGEASELTIGATRYIPKQPSSLMKSNGILFANTVGDPKSTRELVGIIEAYIHQHYLLDDRSFAKMAAYYVLLTWVYDSFSAIPYLRAVGDYGSGKSQLMLRIGHVCYRMMATGGAGTAASLFRALDQFRGTAFMDEMDLSDGGDMANDMIKILNLGAMKNNPVWRLDEFINASGSRDYEVKGYDIFGPKLIAMRGDFKDQAVSSRCLTVRLMGKEPMELKAAGVKLHLDEAFYEQAQAIRNLLMRWRLEKWRPEIPVGEELMDLAIPARLNQVTMPLKAIAVDDTSLMRDITIFIRSLNDELILERGMGLDARVMEALVAVVEGDQKRWLQEGDCGPFGNQKFVLHKYLAKVTNEIIDAMNRTDGDEKEEDEQIVRRKREVTSHKVGKISRDVLQLHSYRKNDGYAVLIDFPKIEALKVKYGLVQAPDPKQSELW
ncbi:MAG: toprim domain-containing protein [Candidatus Paceibacterota bacterium]|jgi:hypothetical protein